MYTSNKPVLELPLIDGIDDKMMKVSAGIVLLALFWIHLLLNLSVMFSASGKIVYGHLGVGLVVSLEYLQS